MYVVRWQQAITQLVDGRFEPIIGPVHAKAVDTLSEATALALLSFAESSASSHYVVISNDGKFVRDMIFGSILRGFRLPTIRKENNIC
jgi:hypothetical protein